MSGNCPRYQYVSVAISEGCGPVRGGHIPRLPHKLLLQYSQGAPLSLIAADWRLQLDGGGYGLSSAAGGRGRGGIGIG